MAGGYKPVASDDAEVTASSCFAVAARGRSENASISPNAVLRAERQVVEGEDVRDDSDKFSKSA